MTITLSRPLSWIDQSSGHQVTMTHWSLILWIEQSRSLRDNSLFTTWVWLGQPRVQISVKNKGPNTEDTLPPQRLQSSGPHSVALGGCQSQEPHPSLIIAPTGPGLVMDTAWRGHCVPPVLSVFAAHSPLYPPAAVFLNLVSPGGYGGGGGWAFPTTSTPTSTSPPYLINYQN